jgi:hypothetical protein
VSAFFAVVIVIGAFQPGQPLFLASEGELFGFPGASSSCPDRRRGVPVDPADRPWPSHFLHRLNAQQARPLRTSCPICAAR